jgi:hypothetical protein
VPLDLAHFVTIDRYDAMDRAGAEVSHFLRTVGEASFDAWRADAHAQFVDDDTGVGGYVTVPAARAEQTQRIGNVDIGLLYMPELAPKHLSAVLHAGAALPTSGTNNPVVPEVMVTRIADTVLGIPAATTVRAGGSLLWRDEPFFARGDLALDANVDTNAHATTDPILRTGAGVGVIAGAAALMAEAEVLVGGPFNSAAGTGALSVRLDAGPFQIYGAYEFGLDHTTRSEMTDAFILGTDVPL